MKNKLVLSRRSYIQTALGLLLLVVIGSVATFSQSVKKPGYGILIDNTGSLRSQFPREIEIAKEIVNQLDGNSSISVFMFATVSGQEVAVATAGIECSSEKAALVRQLDAVRIEGGQTLLLGSISMVGIRLGSEKPATCPEYSEKKLIVISDGEDRVSKITASELAAELKAAGTVVYAIGLIDELLTDRGFVEKSAKDKAKSAKSEAKEFLTNITKETGGKVVFPKKKQSASEIVAELLGVTPKVSK